MDHGAAWYGDELGDRSTPPTSVRDLQAVLRVSQAIAAAGDLPATLELIALTAGELLETGTSAVLMRDPNGGDSLSVVASAGLSDDYVQALNTTHQIRPGHGPTGTALATRRPAVVQDIEEADTIGPWLDIARAEGYVGIISAPLVIGDDALGVLNVYRRRSVETTERELRLLTAVAGHAAIAIHNARLIEAANRHVESLRSLVVSLRAQAYEFSNRLHAIGGLLALGDVDAARGFLDEVGRSFGRSYDVVTRCISEISTAAFVLAQMSLASDLGIDFRLAPHSNLYAVPAEMTTASLIAVVGDLLADAFDVASAVPVEHRRVTLHIRQTPSRTRIVVRNRATGTDHALVQQTVRRMGGQIAVDVDRYGWTRSIVDLPGAVSRESRVA